MKIQFKKISPESREILLAINKIFLHSSRLWLFQSTFLSIYLIDNFG